jgi:uncharacterized protein (UPF0212 family)
MPQQDEKDLDDYAVQATFPYVITGDFDDENDAAEAALEDVSRSLQESGKDYIDVSVGAHRCPDCSQGITDAVEVSGTALVAIVVETTVFNSESRQQAVDVLGAELDDVISPFPSMETNKVELVE